MMDKIELLRKGREKYEMLVVTRHVREEEHFIGVLRLMRRCKRN